ncbi:MAG: PLDc_N domain-containing protein [Candidatus Omnitrophica bacterium]|nr:PLDc_N domain-containing protein [Candidatus Omnitrophota bacterium]
MEFILGAAILILDIWAVLEALKGPLTNDKKILWVILIIFLPILGLILYYLMGRPGQSLKS